MNTLRRSFIFSLIDDVKLKAMNATFPGTQFHRQISINSIVIIDTTVYLAVSMFGNLLNHTSGTYLYTVRDRAGFGVHVLLNLSLPF